MGAWEHWFVGCWWIFLIFIFMMVVACMFVMRRCSCMSSWHHPGENLMRPSGDSAEEILNKRYALGEIDGKEFEEKRAGIIRKADHSQS